MKYKHCYQIKEVPERKLELMYGAWRIQKIKSFIRTLIVDKDVSIEGLEIRSNEILSQGQLDLLEDNGVIVKYLGYRDLVAEKYIDTLKKLINDLISDERFDLAKEITESLENYRNKLDNYNLGKW